MWTLCIKTLRHFFCTKTYDSVTPSRKADPRKTMLVKLMGRGYFVAVTESTWPLRGIYVVLTGRLAEILKQSNSSQEENFVTTLPWYCPHGYFPTVGYTVQLDLFWQCKVEDYHFHRLYAIFQCDFTVVPWRLLRNSRYPRYAIWPRAGACHANHACAAHAQRWQYPDVSTWVCFLPLKMYTGITKIFEFEYKTCMF